METQETISFADFQRIAAEVAKDMPDATKRERESETRIRLNLLYRDIETGRGKGWIDSVPPRVPGPPKKIRRSDRIKSETEKLFGKSFEKMTPKELTSLLSILPVQENGEFIAAIGYELQKRKDRNRLIAQNRSPKWRKSWTKGSFRISDPTSQDAKVRKVTAEKETNRQFIKVSPAVSILTTTFDKKMTLRTIDGKVWVS
jgi:hypothetical protein